MPMLDHVNFSQLRPHHVTNDVVQECAALLSQELAIAQAVHKHGKFFLRSWNAMLVDCFSHECLPWHWLRINCCVA